MHSSGSRIFAVRRLAFLSGLLVLLSSSAVVAGPLKKGERELAFRASYVDLNAGSANGMTIARQRNIDVSVLGGWLVTDGNEVGLTASYARQETSGYGLIDRTVDGTTLGVFYDYNFRTGGMVAPYVGVGVSAMRGDIADAYDAQYGGEFGIKIYPWDHAGFAVAADYTVLNSKADRLPNATSLALSAAIAVKF